MSASLGFVALQIAIAIALDAGALIVWNVGSRSPGTLIADIRAGLRDRSTVIRGLLRFVAGGLGIYIALTISAHIARNAIEASIISGLALLTALLLEQLIGNDLRARRGAP